MYLWEERHNSRAFAPSAAIEVAELGALKAKHKATSNPEDERYVVQR